MVTPIDAALRKRTQDVILGCDPLFSPEAAAEADRLWQAASLTLGINAGVRGSHNPSAQQRAPADVASPDTHGKPHSAVEEARLPDSFRDMRNAFDRGDVLLAKKLLHGAYERGDRSVRLVLLLCETLQRLGESKDALAVLQKADVAISSNQERAALFLQRAQIESSLGLWAEAARSYDQLSEVETRPAALRNATLQLAAMQSRAGDRTRAAELLQTFLSKSPSDEVARRQLMALAQPPEPPAINLAVSDAL